MIFGLLSVLDTYVTEIYQILDHALKSGKQVVHILEISDSRLEPLHAMIYNTDIQYMALASL